jgi:hypothetical protein
MGGRGSDEASSHENRLGEKHLDVWLFEKVGMSGVSKVICPKQSDDGEYSQNIGEEVKK